MSNEQIAIAFLLASNAVTFWALRRQNEALQAVAKVLHELIQGKPPTS